MTATHTHEVATATEKEVAMCATYTTGSVSVSDQGDDAFRIDCSRCGEQVTYRFRAFTVVEADRHEAWCAKHKA